MNPIKLKCKPDVIIYTTFGMLPIIPVLLKVAFPSARLISVVHDLRFFLETRPPRFFILFFQLKLLNVVSDLVLVPSKQVKELWISGTGCPAEKIRISFSPPELPQSARASIIYTGVPQNFLFYPATIVDSKNHKTLVEALSFLVRDGADISVVLCGSISRRELWNEVQGLTREYRVESRWIHLGFVPEEVKNSLYKSAVALIMPSTNDSFAIPVWEAFYHGCPVLCSNSPDLLEQTGGAALYFDPVDVHDIARKIRSVLDDPAQRSSLSQKGRARLQHAFGASYGESWKQFLIPS